MGTNQQVQPADLGLFRVLDDDNRGATDLQPPHLVRLYRAMVLTRLMDARMMNLQRQGRIGFYGTATGQEAATIASAYAAEKRDWIFPALREGSVAVLRGLPLVKAVSQFIGNDHDDCRGRQMPCHPTFREGNYVSMSSCIATQVLHAVGAAHAARLRKDGAAVIGYLGDGATSEPDFHVAMNFAGVYRLPLVLFCQNNQWAISVPVSRQTASQTIAVKARAYGVEGVRVDGNDALAVYEVTRRALQKAREGGGPTFIEALTYRLSGHSSSDDPTRYRSEDEVALWRARDPLERMRAYLMGRKLWDDARQTALETELGEEISRAIEEAETYPPPPPQSLFDDVYASLPWNLREQKEDMIHGSVSS